MDSSRDSKVLVLADFTTLTSSSESKEKKEGEVCGESNEL